MSSSKSYSSSLCSCIICKKEFSQKGIHSHYYSAHTITGHNHTIIAGKKSKHFRNGQTALLNARKLLYANNLSKCKQCNVPLAYEKKYNLFCNKSCAAKFNNSIRDAKSCNKQKITIQKTLAFKYIDVPDCKNKQPVVKHIKPLFCPIHLNQCIICNKLFYKKSKLKTCSKICLSILFSRIATANPKMGGNRNNKAYGWYLSPSAGRVWLESSYELKVAMSLDKNNIKWTRPAGIPYYLNKHRIYYPDFYIIKHNIYLDPKNSFLIIKDCDKINAVRTQNNINLLILTKEQLDWDIINKLCLELSK